MDVERQIHLNFLDEAEKYFDSIESNLLGLAHKPIDSQQIDLMLRAAHSVKGAAGMMGFAPLGKVAHRLEDFFKILRVRYSSSSVDMEIETLLLQSVDCLRQISNLNRQDIDIQTDWISNLCDPIFDRLREYLGDLQDADEDALMAQDEDINPALLMFEEGVGAVLDRFEIQLIELTNLELAEELAIVAKELIAFGQMAELNPFIDLCQSIRQQIQTISTEQITLLAEHSLRSWRRSHALVQRGQIDRLPSQLQLDGGFYFNETKDRYSLDPLTELPNSFIELESSFEDEEPLLADSFSLETLVELQAAFDLGSPFEDEAPLLAKSFSVETLNELQAAFDLELPHISELEDKDLSTPIFEQIPTDVGKMVRVPLAQLKQFNHLFEKLILERNIINLRLKQLHSATSLMRPRMEQMETSNYHLKQWYDRASAEGFLPDSIEVSKPEDSRFDPLELDRYNDVHLICQEQIETIVQLQEVTTDIEVGLTEIDRAIHDLGRTTKSLQNNTVRTQMVPFSEAIGRFHRIIRDLNLQFDKQVCLKVEGENTLIDRSIIEIISDPLMHLLRNAFDHGIEDSKTRLAVGKPTQGTIEIQAIDRGNRTVITLRDDGGGIPLQKIRARICSMGIPSTQVAEMNDPEILEWIFEPGFSTAQEVTELSGRGVGMDVVRTNLRTISGDVRVETQPGMGTTFTLNIPFSLSISRVAIVERAGIVFALQMNSIQEIIPFLADEIIISTGKPQISWHDKLIPLIRLEQALSFNRPNRGFILTGNPAIDRPTILIVGDKSNSFAIEIDRFWGEQEATIRQIQSPLTLPPGFVSSIIFGDGKVIPIVDYLPLVEECLNQKIDRLIPTIIKNIDSPPIVHQPLTILIVDDSINVRRYLELTLSRAGYHVEQARDGQEAVDRLLGGLAVSAVICDLEMPRLDGYGVLEELKSRAEFQNLPIAMLSSRSNEKHRKLAMNLGAAAYFSKPYNEQELLAKLAQLVEYNYSRSATRLVSSLLLSKP
jgi:two-component system, chemotaxis family, sensor histidine kinase and response regulator PixL